MDAKLGNNEKSNIADGEKNFFQKMLAESKQTIFETLIILLKEQEEVSFFIAAIFGLINFLQFISFAFHIQVSSFWNFPSIAENIYKGIKYLQLIPYTTNLTFGAYIAIFYIAFFFVIFVVLLFWYIRHAINTKKFTFVWPVHALRILINLFLTVLFVPFFGYFVSVLECSKNSNGKLVHSLFPETACWSGTYFIHGILAIFISIVFLALCLVMSLIYFESRPIRSHSIARRSSRPHFLLLIYEAILIILLTFLKTQESDVIITATIFIGSVIIFYNFHFDSPFFRERAVKLWSALTAVNLWTAVMLIFSAVMENNLFEGSIIAWIVGIPFVTLIVVTDKEYNLDLLLLNSNKFQSGKYIQKQIHHLLKLLSWESSNSKNASILLDGFLEIHKQTCNKDDCPLKEKNAKSTKISKLFLYRHSEGFSEKQTLILHLMYQMLVDGLKSFPDDTNLRISLAFFMLDKMKNKKQALQEFINAEQSQPMFDEEFIIMRNKRIIEDEIMENQNEEQASLDVISEMNFQNHLRTFQANIEKSSLLHLEFWSQLLEEKPDLAKLDDIGAKISKSLQSTEEQWNRIQRLGVNNAKSMRLYGRFLIEITNDTETGEDLIKKSRDTLNLTFNKKNQNLMNFTSEGDFIHDSTPMIFISGEQEKLALITHLNMAASALFGYNKNELINRKINVLMPQLYSKSHDKFMNNYLNHNESYLVNKNKERLVFGRNKAGYIFPFYLSLKSTQTMNQGLQLIGVLRTENTFKNSAYVLTDLAGNIEGISSGSINLLKIDVKKVLQSRTNIEDFVPNLLKHKQNYFTFTAGNTRGVAKVVFNYPRDSEYVTHLDEKYGELTCHLNEISFSHGKEVVGYYFRFETAIPKVPVNLVTDYDRRAQLSNFQFKHNNSPYFVGEYADNVNTLQNIPPQTDTQRHYIVEDLMNSENNPITTDHAENPAELTNKSLFLSTRQTPLVNEISTPKIDFGMGIKTLRLWDGRIMEIEENDSEDEEQQQYQRNQNETDPNLLPSEAQKKEDRSNQEDASFSEFNKTLKSKKVFSTVINDKSLPSSLKKLKIALHLIILGLIGLSVADYLINNSEVKTIKTNIDSISLSYQICVSFMNVLSNTRDLYLMNLALLTPSLGYDEDTLRDSIQSSLNQISANKILLDENIDTLSDAQLALFNDATIPLQRLNEDADMKGLDQAIDLIVSKGIELVSLDLDDIDPSNSDYYYLTYNLLNDFYLALLESSELYTSQLTSSHNNEVVLLIIFILSALILSLLAVLLFVALFNVNKTREAILCLFIEIPEKIAKGLYLRCENFIANLQIGDEDEIESDMDEDEAYEKQNLNEDDSEIVPRKKKRKFKNSRGNNGYFFLYFLVIALAIEAFFIYNFLMAHNLFNTINVLTPEIQATTSADSFYSFVNNAQRQILIDDSLPILTVTSPVQTAEDNIKDMYNLDTKINKDHSIYIKKHSEEYTDLFNSIMMDDTCSVLSSDDDCTTFADGSLVQGLLVGQTRHFENIRNVLSLYQKYKNGATWSETTTPKTVVSDSVENNLLNIMILPRTLEINEMQHVYIHQSYKLLMANLISSIKQHCDDHLERRIILLVLFIVLILAFYIVIWLPWMSKITRDIWRTKSNLGMIPFHVISRIKNLQLFIRKLWIQRPPEY